jgi:type I restriction enzyme, R subunit
MYKKLDEEFYVENTFLSRLQKLGWHIFRQNKDDPEDIKQIISFSDSFEPVYGNKHKFREDFRSILLEDEVKKSIKEINPWIEEDQINEVARRIITPEANSLLEANQEIQDVLLENITVYENRKTQQKSPTVKLIDFKNPKKNSFIAIAQFKVNIPGTEKHIIPDIVLFINGIPFIVVECKSPTISEPIQEGFTQLLRYQNRRGIKEGNEKLFWYNLLMVITTRQTTRYGTITAGVENFVEWKDTFPYSLSDISDEHSVPSQDILIQGMLSKKNLLDLISIYSLFKEDDKGKKAKIVARYQQFRTVKKTVQRIKTANTPLEKGGIVWHTQGSGKSLTMMYTVREMYRDDELKNFKIVFVTDRKDLERQLTETSKSVGYTVHLAEDIRTLQGLLKNNTPDLVMGMIHKFQERDLRREFPLLNTSPNILIMIDEAHRSQYKLLGANLNKSLPKAIKIAYTGTPIDKTEPSFGDYIDKYTIKQAVEDGVTVEIIYEGRTHKGEMTDIEAANEKFEDVFVNYDIEEKNRILGKYTWRSYLEDRKVIKEKAEDMIDHYVKYIFPNHFKAQVVTVSRIAAIRYKKELETALTKKIKELKKGFPNIDINLLENMKVEVVISGSPNDPPKYHPYTDSSKHKDIISRFKRPFTSSGNNGDNIPGDIGILVVQKMLITGFDAPVEQVMYLDNVINDHNLLQAIARVNRIYEGKKCGFIVDYVGVLNHLREALSIYADEDIDEISKVVINKSKSIDDLEFIFNRIIDFFKQNNLENWRENIDGAIELLADEKIRDEFINLARCFNQAIDKVLPDPLALKYVRDLKIINFIRQSARNTYRDEKLSIKDASNKVREIVEEYLVTKGVDPKIPPLHIFSDQFMQSVKAKKSKKTQSEELKIVITDYIKNHREEDPEFYERFADRLERLLQEYQENWDLLVQQLSKLIEDMRKGREAEESFNLDTKKEMPFMGILKKSIFGKTPVDEIEEDDIGLLIGLTQDISAAIEKEVRSVDFWNNPTKQKRLKNHIFLKILIKESKYQKVFISNRNEITQKLLETAFRVYGGDETSGY